jgi:hypothetical protein
MIDLRVSLIGLELDVSLSCLLLITGLILSGRGHIIMTNDLSRLPSMDHGEVLGEFSASTFPRKKYLISNDVIIIKLIYIYN